MQCVTFELQQKMVDIFLTQMLQWSNGALVSGPSWQIIEFQMFSPLIFSLSRERSYFVLATKLLYMWLFHIEVSTQVLYYGDHHKNLGCALIFSVWWALQRKRFSWKPEEAFQGHTEDLQHWYLNMETACRKSLNLVWTHQQAAEQRRTLEE